MFYTLHCLFTVFVGIINVARGEWIPAGGAGDQQLRANFVAATWTKNNSVFMAGYQSTGGIIIKSNDFGLSWALSTAEFSFDFINDIDSCQVQDLTVAVAETGIIYSNIGNAGWELMASLSMSLFSVSIGDNGLTFVCGESNSVFVSDLTVPATSAQWNNSSPSNGVHNVLDSDGTLFDIATSDGVNVITVGSSGTIAYSTTAGRDWHLPSNSTLHSANEPTLYCVEYSSSGIVAIAGGDDNTALITYDHGDTWQVLTIFTTSSVTIKYHSICFISHTLYSIQAFVGGSNGEIYFSSYAISDQHAPQSWIKAVQISRPILSLSVLQKDHGVIGSNSESRIYTWISGMFLYCLLLACSDNEMMIN